MKKNEVHNLILCALCITIGLILPFAGAHIPLMGQMFLPLHFPVFLCGLICGWRYGLFCGVILPLLRSVLFGMPPLYPIAVVMAFELGTYGFITGFIIQHSSRKFYWAYIALIIAMIGGRAIGGLSQWILMTIAGTPKEFTWDIFVNSYFVIGLPGIVMQLIIIPFIYLAAEKTGGLKHFSESSKTETSVK